MGDRIIGTSVVEDFLASLTETEAGPDEWPEYQALLDALDAAPELRATFETGAGVQQYALVFEDPR